MIDAYSQLPRADDSLLGPDICGLLAELDALDERRQTALAKLNAAQMAVIKAHREDAEARAESMRDADKAIKLDREDQARTDQAEIEAELEALRIAFARCEDDVAAIAALKIDELRPGLEAAAEAARKEAIQALDVVSRAGKRRGALTDTLAWLESPSNNSGLRPFNLSPLGVPLRRDSSTFESVISAIGLRLENEETRVPTSHMPRSQGPQKHIPPQRQMRRPIVTSLGQAREDREQANSVAVV
jgi:hypothetical protein